MDLANVMARHRKITIDALTRTITTTSETHPELLQHLNQMWRKEPADRTSEDRVWIEAVTNLAPELRTSLRDRAYNTAQYAAARCLTYVSATTPA